MLALRILRTYGVLKRTLETVDLVGVRLQAIGHRLRARQNGIAARHKARSRLGHAAHELAALVRTGLLVRKVGLFHLESHRLAAPLLRKGDGVREDLLARGRGAIVAYAQRQIDAQIVVVAQ